MWHLESAMLFCKHLVIPLRFAWYSPCESIGIVSPTSRIYLNDIQVLIVKAMLTFMMINEINRYSFIFFTSTERSNGFQILPNMTFSRWFSKASEHWCPHLNHQSNAIVCEKHSSEVESGVDGLVQLYVYTLNLTWIRLIKTSLVTFYSQRNGGCKCMYLLPMLLEISWGALRAVPTQTLSWSLSIFIVLYL